MALQTHKVSIILTSWSALILGLVAALALHVHFLLFLKEQDLPESALSSLTTSTVDSMADSSGPSSSSSRTTTFAGSFCGTYRGYTYVGLRCQYVESPLLGLMWYQPSSSHHNVEDPLPSRIRHEPNHNDGLSQFGWNEHDGESFGLQRISDPKKQVNLTVQWVRVLEEEDDRAWSAIDDESSNGRRHRPTHTVGHWTIRVSGEPYDMKNQNQSTSQLSLLWYVAMPDNYTATYDLDRATIVGRDFRSWMNPSVNNTHPTYKAGDDGHHYYNTTYFATFQVPASQHFNPKPTVVEELRNPTSSLPPHLFDPASLYRAETVLTGNQVVQQIFLNVPFEMDFHFELLQPLSSMTESKRGSVVSNATSLDHITKALNFARDASEQRFRETFVKDDTRQWSEEELDTGRYALGNLLSSITYMHGDQQIYDLKAGSVISPPEMSKLTGITIVPDRPDHAQGYLWDDGFHQQLVRHWDLDWSLSILKSWFTKAFNGTAENGKQIDDGWIPRQLILGDEVRWSARPSSWPQVPGTANPPTHIWVLEGILETGNASLVDSFSAEIWSSLDRNLQWYIRTQASSITGFFAWAGKTKDFCLPSGMDDYPRAPIETGQEAHLDLHTWMIVSTRVAAKLASRLNKTAEATRYGGMSRNLTRSLITNFWDNSRDVFDDWYYVHSDKNKTIKEFVGHFGYLNFWPVFLDVLPTDTPIFEKVITKLLDKKNGVWTQHGLRSLSVNDPAFGMAESYWTGPIWYNVNFLAASSLFKYFTYPRVYPMPEPVRTKIRKAYHDLHQSLVDLVVNSHSATGFIWETYNGTDGKGFNNHPFTGWSALLVNVLAELY